MEVSLPIPHHSIHLDASEGISQTSNQSTATNYCDDAKRWVKNTSVVMARNAASVMIPTAIREGVRRTLLASLAETHPELMTNLSYCAGLLPVLLQLVGIGSDLYKGKQTPETLYARIGLIFLSGGCVAAAATQGRMLAVAPAILSANIYAGIRDTVQHFIRLKDNNAPDSSNRCQTYTSASLAYMANQLLVGVGMDSWSATMTKDLNTVAANMVARSLLNFAGETVDELVFLHAQHYYSEGTTKGPLDLSLDCSGPKDAANTLLRSFAGRSALFSAAFNAAYAPPEKIWQDYSETAAMWASNAIPAAVLGIGYSAFVGSHMQKSGAEQAVDESIDSNPHRESDIEPEARSTFTQQNATFSPLTPEGNSPSAEPQSAFFASSTPTARTATP